MCFYPNLPSADDDNDDDDDDDDNDDDDGNIDHDDCNDDDGDDDHLQQKKNLELLTNVWFSTMITQMQFGLILVRLQGTIQSSKR